MKCSYLLCCVFLASCAPQNDLREQPTPTSDQRISSYSEPTNDVGFDAAIDRADRIVVARLVNATARSGIDTFALDTEWAVQEVLKGSEKPFPNIRFVRDVRGWVSGAHYGMGTLLYPERDYLLYISRDVYERRVSARDGSPEPGASGVGLGYFLVSGDQIVRAGVSDEWPSSLEDLRRTLKE